MKSLRNPNRKPTHPGAVLREDVLPELGITQATLASHLGVSRLTVSDLLHEKRALTAEMAVRVAKVIGGTPESWLRMQEALDLWEEKHAGYVLRR
jgi:addiction module HigA family antidote